MTKAELSQKRNEVDNLINQGDALYLLVMDGIYYTKMKDGKLPFAIKNAGYTLSDMDKIADNYKARIKDFLLIPQDHLKEVLSYFNSFISVNKKIQSHNYTIIVMKEVSDCINRYLKGSMDKNLYLV